MLLTILASIPGPWVGDTVSKIILFLQGIYLEFKAYEKISLETGVNREKQIQEESSRKYWSLKGIVH